MTESKQVTAPPYVCKECGASGVKLWRGEDQSSPLLCVNCASRDQGLNASLVNEAGLQRAHGFDRDGNLYYGVHYDYNIGRLIPAVFDPRTGGYLSRINFTQLTEELWMHYTATR